MRASDLHAEETTAQKEQLSDSAVVKNVAYTLLVDEKQLFLSSQPIEGDDREKRNKALSFSVPESAEVKELTLAKLNGKNLMAVVKLHRAGQFEFHCLTFIAPTGGHVRDKFAFHQARFHTTHKDLKTLAAGGRHFEGSVLIVLGNFEIEDEDFEDPFADGLLYFSGCPWPPSDGQKYPFRVKSVGKKAE